MSGGDELVGQPISIESKSCDSKAPSTSGTGDELGDRELRYEDGIVNSDDDVIICKSARAIRLTLPVT